VTLLRGSESSSFKVNQREKSGEARLGRFHFAKGTRAVITIGNVGTDGYVIIDGLQLLPVK
jgi:hypothetical protein